MIGHIVPSQIICQEENDIRSGGEDAFNKCNEKKKEDLHFEIFVCVECNSFLELAMMPFCAVFVCVCARACMMKKNVHTSRFIYQVLQILFPPLYLSRSSTEREREREREREKEYRIQFASTKDEGEV